MTSFQLALSAGQIVPAPRPLAVTEASRKSLSAALFGWLTVIEVRASLSATVWPTQSALLPLTAFVGALVTPAAGPGASVTSVAVEAPDWLNVGLPWNEVAPVPYRLTTLSLFQAGVTAGAVTVVPGLGGGVMLLAVRSIGLLGSTPV